MNIEYHEYDENISDDRFVPSAVHVHASSRPTIDEFNTQNV
jgi:hypothetical protein